MEPLLVKGYKRGNPKDSGGIQTFLDRPYGCGHEAGDSMQRGDNRLTMERFRSKTYIKGGASKIHNFDYVCGGFYTGVRASS